MLLELVVVEQRHAAVREVLDGAPVTVVARRFGVARQTVHEWVLGRKHRGLGGEIRRSGRWRPCE
jgi:transposase-like protein